MIDIHTKPTTLRYARAEGTLDVPPKVIDRIDEGDLPKGDPLEVARSAALQGAKQASDWIIACHPIPLDGMDVNFRMDPGAIVLTTEVRAVWRTGVEMEALSAASAGLLNLYDMLKPLDVPMEIQSVRLVEKRGGTSDFRETFDEPLRTGVLVISDGTYEGDREDRSGQIIREFLTEYPVDTEVYEVLPDEQDRIAGRLHELIDEEGLDLVFTTGGTGLGPRDVTPEATRTVIEREIPGMAERIRQHGMDRTPYAMLSRERVGARGTSLVVNLPGSSQGARESLQALLPGMLHVFPMLWGGGHHPDSQ